MVRSRVTATLVIALLVAPAALFAIACSRPPEQQMLRQFFQAARARDNTTLGMMSAVEFSPNEQGTVSSFDIISVSPEQRTPLDLKALVAAQAKAREAEAEFAKRKKEYQDTNLQAIEQVIKAERDPKAKLAPALMAVKAQWDKWREETSTFSKATAAARAALADASGPAEASLTQPGRPPLDPAQFDGELVTKAVTLNAEVSPPGGGAAQQKTMVVTMQRAVGKVGAEAREGRWVITQITGV